jgi:hypothetical protein
MQPAKNSGLSVTRGSRRSAGFEAVKATGKTCPAGFEAVRAKGKT